MSHSEIRSPFKELINILAEGNSRFVAGKSTADLSLARRKELLKGQHPFATVLSCSDSRIVPEFIFDQGMGDLFIVRTAGEVLDDIVLASMEYGVEHLGTPLVIVLGHTNCGAVNATVSKAHVHGHLPLLVEKIHPAVMACNEGDSASKDDYINEVIRENTLEIVENIVELSEPIKAMVDAGKALAIGAMYIMETGEVKFLSSAHSHRWEQKNK
jgi:carbonic anhydrase